MIKWKGRQTLQSLAVVMLHYAVLCYAMLRYAMRQYEGAKGVLLTVSEV